MKKFILLFLFCGCLCAQEKKGQESKPVMYKDGMNIRLVCVADSTGKPILVDPATLKKGVIIKGKK